MIRCAKAAAIWTEDELNRSKSEAKGGSGDCHFTMRNTLQEEKRDVGAMVAGLHGPL